MIEANVRAILLDIEGTTTSMEFVYEVLFPFARRHLKEFVRRNYHSRNLQADISALKAEQRSDDEANHAPPVWRQDSTDAELESVTQYVYWLMDQDRKSKALKSLQGKIWKEGYLGSELLGHVYPDVRPAFARWREQHKAIYIFSSGSVLAQKLLFAHTTDGDLTRYITDYFDTTTGVKTAAASYESIADKIGSSPTDILFVSDVTAELDAAQKAGMKTTLCVRTITAEAQITSHPVVETFDVVFP
jgi:enolase-phosphatase E1